MGIPNKLNNKKNTLNSQLPTLNSHISYGYTLIEILIVVFIFAILMFITLQSLTTTFKGARKSENEIVVRENVDFAASTIERILRNVKEISCPDSKTLSFVDYNNTASSFTCEPSGSTEGRIASGSAFLTNSTIHIDCTLDVFTCTAGAAGVPDSVRIKIEGKNADASGTDVSSVKVESSVLLRYYK